MDRENIVPVILKFKINRLLEKHFEDHGEEFGALDPADCESKAISFLTSQSLETIIESIRLADGARIRYNYVTQEFGIVSADNYIQTYFKPDPRFHGMSTNRAYYDWECKRK